MRDLREGYEERLEIERRLKELQDILVALCRTMRETRRTKIINDRILEDLEAGGVRAAIALRKLKFAGIPTAERAKQARELFREDVLCARPDSPHTAKKLGSSSDSHHMNVQVQDTSFSSSDGQQVRVRCYRGGSAVAATPVLIFFHGEGYVVGDLDTHDWLCRSLAALGRVTIAAVDYRRAPESCFPAAFNDAYEALCWVASGGLGGAGPAMLGVAGDSNGAALAVACCLQAQQLSGPEVSVQILFYPWLDLRPDSPSMEASDDDQVELLADLDWSRSIYQPPFADSPLETPGKDKVPDELGGEVVSLHPQLEDGRFWFQDWRASPLLAPSFASMPPVFLAYAGDDPLASDAVRFADRLRTECGEDSVHTLHLQGPLGHGFAKRSDSAQAHAAVAAAAAFASAALRGPLSPTRARSQSPTRA